VLRRLPDIARHQSERGLARRKRAGKVAKRHCLHLNVQGRDWIRWPQNYAVLADNGTE
jgi:hypothetical protein